MLDPERGRLEGKLELDLGQGEATALTLGAGFDFDHVELTAGEIDRLGSRGVILHPDSAASAATLRWSGSLPKREPRGRFIDREGAWLTPATGWYPRPAPQAFGYRLTVDLPSRLQAVSEGSRSADSVRDGRRRVVFNHPAPTAGIHLAAGEWQKASRRAAFGTVYTFFPAALAELSPLYLERTVEHLNTYSARIGTPPHDTYSVVAAQQPVGLAFSGFTYIGEAVLRLPFIPNTSLPHEVVHNWWGRGVYVDATQGNWSEALTQYMGDYYQAELRGSEEAQRMRGDWLRDQAALPAAADYPLGGFRSKASRVDDIVGYQRGAWLFHTLRRTLGDDGFTAAVRTFYQTHRHRWASWNDLRTAFAAVVAAESDDSATLSALFDHFLTTTGAPQLELTRWQTIAEDDGYRVEAELLWEGGYPVRVPLRVKMQDGRLITTEAHLAAEERKTVTVSTAERPLRLAVDPTHQLYRQLAPGEGVPILRDLLLAESPALASPWSQLAPIAEALTPHNSLAPQQRFEVEGLERERPLLIVGPTDFVTASLEAVNACIFHRTPPIEADTVAWATRTGTGYPVLALRSDSAQAAAQALRRLERFGRHSFVAFGERVDSGLYPPAEVHGLQVELAGDE